MDQSRLWLKVVIRSNENSTKHFPAFFSAPGIAAAIHFESHYKSFLSSQQRSKKQIVRDLDLPKQTKSFKPESQH